MGMNVVVGGPQRRTPDPSEGLQVSEGPGLKVGVRWQGGGPGGLGPGLLQEDLAMTGRVLQRGAGGSVGVLGSCPSLFSSGVVHAPVTWLRAALRMGGCGWAGPAGEV